MKSDDTDFVWQEGHVFTVGALRCIGAPFLSALRSLPTAVQLCSEHFERDTRLPRETSVDVQPGKGESFQCSNEGSTGVMLH